MNNRKKAFLLLWTYLILWYTPKLRKDKNKVNYNDNYDLVSSEIFATYNNYNLYMVPIENSQNICDDNNDNIYIIDYRESTNPVLKVNNSYRITSINEMINIINVIQEYDRKYPSKWNRTTKSMVYEWITHNICYYLDIEKDRAYEVDFDNDDEVVYSNIFSILKSISSGDDLVKTKNK